MHFCGDFWGAGDVKPDSVRNRIERLVSDPYLELFARETRSYSMLRVGIASFSAQRELGFGRDLRGVTVNHDSSD